MDKEQFRRAAYAAIDSVCDYFDSVQSGQTPVFPAVVPNSISAQLTESAPVEGEEWSAIIKDYEGIILPNTVAWAAPTFMAYFPANTTYESILADILAGAVSNPGFNWSCSPACTELEVTVLDWVAKLLYLDPSFYNASGIGGGIILGSASESLLTVAVAARERAIGILQKEAMIRDELVAKFVILGTDQTHSLGAKAGLILGLPFRAIPTRKEDNWSLRGADLNAVLEEEKLNGRIPFMLIATLGSTSTGAIDNIAEITSVAINHPQLFIHVDAAWGGVHLACPEYHAESYLDAINARSTAVNLGRGIGAAGEVHSICTNLHKAGLVMFDASCLWIRDRSVLTEALDITPAYLRNAASSLGSVVDYRNWQLPLGRRFRSLKIYFVLRSFGVKGFQEHQRRLCDLAQVFERYIEQERGFELFCPRSFSLVVFRLVMEASDSLENMAERSDVLNRDFFKRIILREDIHLTATVVGGSFATRIAVGSPFTRIEHVDRVWAVIKEVAEETRSALKRI